MAFCVNCGAKNQEGSNFCANCGTRTNPIQDELPKSDSASEPAASSKPNPGYLSEITLWEGKPQGVSDRLKDVAHVNSTHYKVTNQRIIVRTGLIGKKIEEIELIGVKDISVTQSMADRILGVGSITILSTDKTTPELILDDVKDVQSVKDIIRNAVREEKAAHNVNYREHM